MGKIIVRLGERRIEGLVRTFGERKQGEAIALIGSTGNLIVSIVNGSAETTLGSRVGDPIWVAYTATSKPSMSRAAA
jgi:S-adenosylmethionine hydrolase